LRGPAFGIGGPGFVIVVAPRGAVFGAARLGVDPGCVSRTRARDGVRLILGATTTGLFLALRPRFCVSLRKQPRRR